jgi:glycosyltransferase involved in cell wall biosynthesis
MASRPAPAVRPLRLLHVLGYAGAAGRSAGITGVERVVEVLTQGLHAPRFENHVAYPRTGLLYQRYTENAQVLDLEPARRFDAPYRDALIEAIRARDIDVVVSHGLRFDFHAALACRATRIPHVVVRAVALADEQMPALQRFAYGLVDAWTLRSCRGVIAVSEASKRRMVETQHLDPGRVTVIPNGVRMPRVDREAASAARRALGVADGAPLVGGVGQLIARKAFHVLVEAAGRLVARHPQIACAILGEGPERPRLEALARDRGVRLLLPGFCDEPYATMAAFDVAVLPSRAEGMPLVVLEAMGLGVACIATPAAGTVEVIEDGRSGILVPPDDAGALAAALDRLLADAAHRGQLAAAGRARVHAHFGLEAMLARFDAYLHRAAGRAVEGTPA